MNKSHGHEISLATRPWMSTTIQNILETRQDELRQLLDKTSSRIASQEHTKRIPHANHCSRNATNRSTPTTKGCARSMNIRWFLRIVHKYVFQNARAIKNVNDNFASTGNPASWTMPTTGQNITQKRIIVTCGKNFSHCTSFLKCYGWNNKVMQLAQHEEWSQQWHLARVWWS